MRLALTLSALAFAALGTASALAQSPAMFDQYQAANALWGNAPADQAKFLSSYPKLVADHLDGKWFNIGALSPTTADDKSIAASCNRGVYSVLAKDLYSFKMVRAAGTAFQYTSVFTSMGGNRYDMATDATELSHALGEDSANVWAKLQSLSYMNGPVIVSRPSPDILVIENTRDGAVSMYARCPN